MFRVGLVFWLRLVFCRFIDVTTKDGTHYHFKREWFRWYFLKGTLRGKVVKFNSPLRIGNPINLDYHEMDMRSAHEKKPILNLISSPIEKLT
jgi:hypothetical protein